MIDNRVFDFMTGVVWVCVGFFSLYGLSAFHSTNGLLFTLSIIFALTVTYGIVVTISYVLRLRDSAESES